MVGEGGLRNGKLKIENGKLGRRKGSLKEKGERKAAKLWGFAAWLCFERKFTKNSKRCGSEG